MMSGRADDDVLGAWFMWPEGGFSRPRDLPEDSTLVVYFHGNSQDRGFGHRVGWSSSLVLVLLGSSSPYLWASSWKLSLAWHHSPRCCLAKVSTCWSLLPSSSSSFSWYFHRHENHVFIGLARCRCTRCCLDKVSTCWLSTIALLETPPGSHSLNRHHYHEDICDDNDDDEDIYDDIYENDDDDNEDGVSVEYHCFGDSLSELGCSWGWLWWWS